MCKKEEGACQYFIYNACSQKIKKWRNFSVQL